MILRGDARSEESVHGCLHGGVCEEREPRGAGTHSASEAGADVCEEHSLGCSLAAHGDEADCEECDDDADEEICPPVLQLRCRAGS